jgi:hypothetical protein
MLGGSIAHYLVWFEQINGECIEVEAADEADARRKAVDQYRSRREAPRVLDVQPGQF